MRLSEQNLKFIARLEPGAKKQPRPATYQTDNREVSHQYENENEHFIPSWVSWRHLAPFRSDKFVTFQHVQTNMILLICFDMLAGIFRLQMLCHLIIWKRIHNVFVIVFVFVLVRNLPMSERVNLLSIINHPISCLLAVTYPYIVIEFSVRP
jgi:hypothetical protein